MPAFWEWVEADHKQGQVLFIEAVRDELKDGGDDLADWIKSKPAEF